MQSYRLVIAAAVCPAILAAQGPTNVAPLRHLWTMWSEVAGVYESNIDRQPLEATDYGVMAALGSRYQNREPRPSAEAEYEIAVHQYSVTERWDRVSHKLRASLEQRVGRRLTTELTGEASRNGSAEDRELLDQLTLLPRVTLRLDSDRRLRAFAAYRIRRSPVSALEHALNRYAGASFLQRLPGGGAWEAGYRLETHTARGARFSHERQTFATEYVTALGRHGRLAVDGRLRSQRYRARFVEIEDHDVLRHDNRLSIASAWVRELAAVGALTVRYEYEARSSNDPEKSFTGHAVSVSLLRRWR